LTLYARCESCLAAIPVCGGQADPRLCDPHVADLRDRRSLYYSSAHGWPGPLDDLGTLTDRPTDAPGTLQEAPRAIDGESTGNRCGWPVCRRRAFRTHCGDESATCALGEGVGGIIDREDCRSCARAEP